MDLERIRIFASQDSRLRQHFQESVQVRDLNLALVDIGCRQFPETGEFVQFHSQPQELVAYLSGDFIPGFLQEFQTSISKIHPLVRILGPEKAIRAALTPSQISKFLSEFNAEQQQLLQSSCVTGDFSSFQPSAWDQFLNYIIRMLPTVKGKTPSEKVIQDFQEKVNRYLAADGMCYQNDNVILPVAVRRCLNQVSDLQQELEKSCEQAGLVCTFSVEAFLVGQQWPTYAPFLTNLGEKIFPSEQLQKGLGVKTQDPRRDWILFCLIGLILILLIVGIKCRNK